MKIKTITCHDVYNVGASLQAYALSEYLRQQGHEVEIIDYKPDYLNKHYSLLSVDNPRFNKFFLREVYLLAKLPKRVIAFFSKRNRNFDCFKKKYLKLTEKRYNSNEMLKLDCPEADVYIAGSDQIWNPFFQNGKDPAFYLDFVPQEKKSISYAASFAVDSIPEKYERTIQKWLKNLDAISVREKSGVAILGRMGLIAHLVVDPVFLLNRDEWERIIRNECCRKNIFVYDFDKSNLVEELVLKLKDEKNLEVHTAFPMNISGKVLKEMGPREFLGELRSAEIVVSNSFHATAFSLIFHVDFIVTNRKEKINSRMRDLLELLGLSERMVSSVNDLDELKPIEWEEIDKKMYKFIGESKKYLEQQLGEKNYETNNFYNCTGI